MTAPSPARASRPAASSSRSFSPRELRELNTNPWVITWVLACCAVGRARGRHIVVRRRHMLRIGDLVATIARPDLEGFQAEFARFIPSGYGARPCQREGCEAVFLVRPKGGKAQEYCLERCAAADRKARQRDEDRRQSESPGQHPTNGHADPEDALDSLRAFMECTPGENPDDPPAIPARHRHEAFRSPA